MGAGVTPVHGPASVAALRVTSTAGLAMKATLGMSWATADATPETSPAAGVGSRVAQSAVRRVTPTTESQPSWSCSSRLGPGRAHPTAEATATRSSKRTVPAASSPVAPTSGASSVITTAPPLIAVGVPRLAVRQQAREARLVVAVPRQPATAAPEGGVPTVESPLGRAALQCSSAAPSSP